MPLISCKCKALRKDHLASLYIGMSYFKIENYEEALVHLDVSIEVLPTYDAYLYKSKIYKIQSQYKQSEIYLKQALIINNEDNRWTRGGLYLELSILQEALGSLDKSKRSLEQYYQYSIYKPFL